MQFYVPIRKNETELCTNTEQSLKIHCQRKKVGYGTRWGHYPTASVKRTIYTYAGTGMRNLIERTYKKPVIGCPSGKILETEDGDGSNFTFTIQLFSF